MSVVKDLLKRPQGYIRLALCMLLPMGTCIAVWSITQDTVPYYVYRDIIDVALAGGSLMAFTLLAAGARNNPTCEMLFAGLYVIVDVCACTLYYRYQILTPKYGKGSTYIAYAKTTVALFAGLVLWLIDFGLSAVDCYRQSKVATTEENV